MTNGDFMGDELKDLVYLLSKAEDYRKKAKAVSDPGLKAALEAVAREYMLKARELDPSLLSGDADLASNAALNRASRFTVSPNVSVQLTHR